jgi:hypothetical protein
VAADDLTLQRIAQNQATFRRANESIDSVAGKVGVEEEVPFICECADVTCFELVRLTLGEYQEIRRHSRRFFNAPGHQRTSQAAGADVVIEGGARYVIVEKVGMAGAVADGEATEQAG